MARSKRTLAETDANAEAVPASKRFSTGKAKSKEIDAPKPTANNSEPFAKVPVAKEQTHSTNKEAKVLGDASGKTWICLCHVRSERCGMNKSCMCGRYADANPEEDWIVTMKGFELHKEWGLEQFERDQDNFRMHIFNDWSGYGACEVMENMFLAFNKEMKKKSKDVWAIWSIIEGMAMFLNRPAGLDSLDKWHGLGDSEGNAKRVMLFGTALLTTIDVLIEKGLFKPEDSDIRNIGLILGHFLKFAHDSKEMCMANEDGWKKIVLELADKFGIKPHTTSIDHIVSEIRESNDDTNSDKDETPRPKKGTKKENALKSYESKPWVGLITLESLKAGVERSWTYWNWATELSAYSKAQAVKVGPRGPIYGKRIGGMFYDLTAKGNQRQMKHFRLSAEETDEESE